MIYQKVTLTKTALVTLQQMAIKMTSQLFVFLLKEIRRMKTH